MMRNYDVAIIGGGYAGVTAANRLPREVRVALIDPKQHFVHRVRLHERAAGGDGRVKIPFPDMLGAHVAHLRTSAVQVEPGVVRFGNGEELQAKHVLITTGSDQQKGNGVGSYAEATALRGKIAALTPGESIDVRGAGLTGIELAAELAYRRPDLSVYLHGRSPVGAGMPSRAQRSLRRTMEKLGVRLDDVASAATIQVDTTGLSVSRLAQDSSLAVNADGQMLVSPMLRSVPGIWGAGDAVRVAGQPYLRSSCATAIPMGVHAAQNIARALRKESLLPFTFGYTAQCISLGRRGGLILKVDRFDRPTGAFLSGLAAAGVKAGVCAGVIRAASGSMHG